MFIDRNYVFSEFSDFLSSAFCHNGNDFETLTFANSVLKEKGVVLHKKINRNISVKKLFLL